MKNILIKLSIIIALSTSLFADVGEMILKGAVEVALPIVMDIAFKSDSQKRTDKANAEKSMENFKNLFTTKKEPKKETPFTHKKDIQEDDPCIF